MSYVGSPFTHDLFVTYSHGLKQWSQGFVRELETELRMAPRLKQTLSLFLDEHDQPGQGLDPMKYLTRQIQENIEGSAFLNVLMSEHYLESKWCEKERDWWEDNQVVKELPIDGRIAIARIWPTGDRKWPKLLCDEKNEPTIGYDFLGKTGSRPHEWPVPEPTSKGEFREVLLKLVDNLCLKLDALKAELDTRRRMAAEASRLVKQDSLIYVHGRKDREGAWTRVRDSLRDSGFMVTPNEAQPVSRDLEGMYKLRRLRLEAFTSCDAVVLVGSKDGLEVDNDLSVIGRQDCETVRALSEKHLPCAFLDTEGGEIPKDDRVEMAKRYQVRWIDTTHDPWVPHVKTWLAEESARLGKGR